MKKHLILGLGITMLVAMSSMSGCKSYHRSRTIHAGDHNVTRTKTKRGPVYGRKKAVTSRKFNRVPKK